MLQVLTVFVRKKTGVTRFCKVEDRRADWTDVTCFCKVEDRRADWTGVTCVLLCEVEDRCYLCL